MSAKSHLEYECLDFGNRRRLERFGPLLVDRPCPVAVSRPALEPHVWDGPDLHFARTEGASGKWSIAPRAMSGLDTWAIDLPFGHFHLRPTPAGQVGLFPEHLPECQWVADAIGRSDRPIRLLNLFAYTGAMSLAAAQAGAEVTHVDSAKGIVRWGRENFASQPQPRGGIRWVIEDATRFVARELRRGSRYDAVVLDPPSYGHGPAGERWKLQRDLPALVRDCLRLLSPMPLLVSLACHTAGFGVDRLCRVLIAGMKAATERDSHVDWGSTRHPPSSPMGHVAGEPMHLVAADGRRLVIGSVARWTPPPTA